MTDPFSIVTGIIGIVTAGVQLSSTLYDVCEKIGSAPESIENIASDLSFFVIVVDELGKIFASPKKIHSQELEDNVRKIVERCRILFRQINGMIGKTKDTPKLQLKAKVAWVFRESKVNETRANLESLKSTLGLILHTLRLIREERQDDRQERNVLANLLRSQSHSIKVLRSVESEQDIKRQPEVPGNLVNKGNTLTAKNADTLSEVVSPPPYVKNTFAVEGRDPSEWRSFPVMLVSDFEESLGDLYPLWRERFLIDVDMLLQTWRHAPNSEEKALPKSIPYTKFSPDAVFNIEEAKIKEETKAVDVLRQSYCASRKTVTDRLEKLEDRQKKREIGWLDIENAALIKMEAEIIELREKDKVFDIEIRSCDSKRQELKEQHQLALDRCKHRRERKWNGSSQLSAPNEQTSSPEQTRYAQDPLEWLHQETESDQGDEDQEYAEGSQSVPHTQINELPAEAPGEILKESKFHRRDQTRTTSKPSTSGPRSSTPEPSSVHFQSPRSSSPPVGLSNTGGSIRCQRQAWKPPQSFLTGSNTFSTVLDCVRHPQLWFTASRDFYSFYLGDYETPFYRVNLVPDDLSSYETSKVEWTVLQKPWATNKALRAMGFPYLEDSIGFMWIHKNLNWYQVRQIFEFSCGLLDNAMHDSSRNVLQKRSTNAKKSLHERSFLAPLTSREGKNDYHSRVHRWHPTFFHAEDEDLQRRRKRSKSAEFAIPTSGQN